MVETQLCKRRDTSDRFVGCACSTGIFNLYFGVYMIRPARPGDRIHTIHDNKNNNVRTDAARKEGTQPSPCRVYASLGWVFLRVTASFATPVPKHFRPRELLFWQLKRLFFVRAHLLLSARPSPPTWCSTYYVLSTVSIMLLVYVLLECYGTALEGRSLPQK